MVICTSTSAIVGIGKTIANAKKIVHKSNFFILLPPLYYRLFEKPILYCPVLNGMWKNMRFFTYLSVLQVALRFLSITIRFGFWDELLARQLYYSIVAIKLVG